MRVALDVSVLVRPRTGIESYTLGLAEHLAGALGEDRLSFYADSRWPAGQTLFGRPVARLRSLPGAMPDVLHAPATVLPRVSALPTSCRLVVTIHDAIPLLFPDEFPPRVRNAFARALAVVRNGGATVIATSASAFRDLCRSALLPAGRISVVHIAPDERFHRPVRALEIDRVRKRYRLPGPYFLSVSSHVPRKNLPMLVGAFAAFRTLPGAPGDCSLALVGGGVPGLTEVADAERLATLTRPVPQVRLLGRVPDSDLPALYAGALALAYPSRYEGFGLPPLEAMATGTPVICSNAGSLPEVVGPAAIRLPPEDEAAWARSLLTVAESATLRAHLSERGRRWVRRFSWQRVARETIAVYRERVLAG